MRLVLAVAEGESAQAKRTGRKSERARGRTGQRRVGEVRDDDHGGRHGEGVAALDGFAPAGFDEGEAARPERGERGEEDEPARAWP